MLFDVFVVNILFSSFYYQKVIYAMKCLQSLLFSTCVEAHLILSFVQTLPNERSNKSFQNFGQSTNTKNKRGHTFRSRVLIY